MAVKVPWAMLALVTAAACATTPVVSHPRAGTGTAAASSAPADSPSDNSGGLTPSQQATAIRVAQREGWGSQPSSPGVLPSGINPSDPASWPANVDQVWAIATTHEAAMQYVGGGTEAGDGSLPVLVIRLIGNFSWITSGPPGHPNATGNVATIVVDAATGQVTDTGLELDDPTETLPDASVLYNRVVRLGLCADVKVHATYPGGAADFVAGQSAKITLQVGQSFVLTASGSCGVEYEPDDTHLVYSPGQPAPPLFLGGDPNAVTSSPPVNPDPGPTATLAPHPVGFTAIATANTTLPVLVDDQVSAASFDTVITIVVAIRSS